MKTVAAVLLLVGLASCSSLAAPENSIKGVSALPCVANRADLLAMDYWTFDQSPHGVRQVLARPDCHAAGADLIRDYHAALRAAGEPVTHVLPEGEVTLSQNGEMSILYWHEGQARAFAGETAKAISLFGLSLKPADENYGGWNEYARATIAFLEGDIAALKTQREALARKGAIIQLNLSVVDRLIECFGKSYLEAYGNAACGKPPTP